MSPTPSDLTLALWAFASVARELLAGLAIVAGMTVLVLALRGWAEGQETPEHAARREASAEADLELRDLLIDRVFGSGGRGL